MDSNMGRSSQNGDGQNAIVAQLKSFQNADEERHGLLQKLYREVRTLEERLMRRDDDLEAEQETRRLLQANMRETKRDLQYLRQQTDIVQPSPPNARGRNSTSMKHVLMRLKESNTFALALIDGDGVIFQPGLLQAGQDGGSQAAHLLHRAISDHLHDIYDNCHSWSITVYIAANFDGLSRKLVSLGILKAPQDLHTFARAFSCSQPMFNFIDVGMGKERADHKIKEMFRLFVNNMQCKHIIFGGCHDNGYLPNLEPYKRDENVSSRITLLQSTPAERSFQNLGFEMTRFNAVFRDDHLPDSRMMPLRHQSNSSTDPRPQASNYYQAAPPPANVFSPPPLSSTSGKPALAQTTSHTSEQSASTPGNTSTTATPHTAAVLPTATAAKVPIPQVPQLPTPSPSPSSYATASAVPGDFKVINVASSKPAPARKAMFLNAEQQRIDVQLPKVDEGVAKSLSSRIKSHKVCNNWHLLGTCPSGKNCDYSHAPAMSNAERLALKAKARERPCYRKDQCRDVDCLSGHHCPRGDKCESQWCNFMDGQHYVNMTVKLKEYEDGEVEIIR